MNNTPDNAISTSDAINDIQFNDIFDLEDIQRLQDMFSDATGVASIITHPDGKPITNPTNFCKLCSIIRNTKKGCANCFKSDAAIGRKNSSGPIIQQCMSGGLWDAGASITVGGKHIANWLIGQVRNNEVDEKRMVQYADEIGAKREDFMEALKEVSVMSVEQFNKVSNMLFIFANELSEKAYSNWQLKLQNAELGKATILLKESQESLNRQNNLFSSLLKNLPIGVFMVEAPSGKPLIANEAAYKYLGRGILPDASMQNLSEVYQAYKISSRVPYPPEEMPISLGMSGVLSHVDDMVVERPDGSLTRLEIFGSPVMDDKGQIWASLVSFFDITERKQVEEALRKSEAIQGKMVANIGDVIVIIDKDGINRYKSPNIEKLFGWLPKDLVGNSAWDNVHSDDLESAQLFFNAIISEHNATGTIECRYRCKDGLYKWIEFSVVNLLNDPDIKGLLGNYHDITDRKIIMDDLVKAKEQTEESDKLKTAFLNNISHEIRTPFNGLLGFLSIIQENDLSTDERDEYIDIINSSAYRLMNTINDIVEMSQIQAGQMKPVISKTYIRRLISELYNGNKTEAESKGLKFFLNLDLPNNMECIFTDSIKLNSILTILIGNAIKFTKTGLIEFGVKLVDKVDEHAIVTHGGASLQFSVKDTGISIPEDKQQAIFEKFVQVDVSNTRQFEGAGLGLSIAKAYVEMLGGNIWVESEEGKGSVFYFTLPYIVESEEKMVLKSKVAGDEDKINPEVSGLKILIAEDDEESAKLLSLTIRTLSKDVTIVKTGFEAVEVCRKNPEIDLLLMDIKMPGMNGYEATRQIRQFNTNVVIIAQTAYALTGDWEKAIEAGCNDYISKPIKKDQLMLLVQKYFKK